MCRRLFFLSIFSILFLADLKRVYRINTKVFISIPLDFGKYKYLKRGIVIVNSHFRGANNASEGH